ncbi:MAG: flagellar biosynthesis protein FlgD [Pseudomonadales bacterium]|nr:flagellar biosynthesis protein FlgD [Pseudomonadales bacterium]NRA17352.1 flagellar biosynthesis protein FlgD [Oceanospirillaceae bacterium]
MSTINGNNTNVFDQINKANQATDVNSALTSKSQEDSDMFLRLMIAQLKNQDPTSPTDTGAFMAQIADMNQVESMNNLTNSIQSMSLSMISSQSALQASSMVGQTVLFDTDKATANAKGDVEGLYDLPGNTENVRVTVYDKNGAKVDQIELGKQSFGENRFSWHGGSDAADGEYKIKVEAQTTEGSYLEVVSYLPNKVNSVTLGQNGVGMRVNTNGGDIAMSSVKQIGV